MCDARRRRTIKDVDVSEVSEITVPKINGGPYAAMSVSQTKHIFSANDVDIEAWCMVCGDCCDGKDGELMDTFKKNIILDVVTF